MLGVIQIIHDMEGFVSRGIFCLLRNQIYKAFGSEKSCLTALTYTFKIISRSIEEDIFGNKMSLRVWGQKSGIYYYFNGPSWLMCTVCD